MPYSPLALWRRENSSGFKREKGDTRSEAPRKSYPIGHFILWLPFQLAATLVRLERLRNQPADRSPDSWKILPHPLFSTRTTFSSLHNWKDHHDDILKRAVPVSHANWFFISVRPIDSTRINRGDRSAGSIANQDTPSTLAEIWARKSFKRR